MSDQQPLPDEGTYEQGKLDLGGLEQEPPDPFSHIPERVITAFVVVLTEDGLWVGESHVAEVWERIKDNVRREAHLGDLLIGSSAVHENASQQAVANTTANLLMGIMPQATAGAVVNAQMQIARQAQEAAANARILEQVEAGRRSGGIQRPGPGR